MAKKPVGGLKDETFHKILEHNFNRLDGVDGWRMRARYSPSEQRLYYERRQADCAAILADNRRLYEENRKNKLKRSDLAGGYPMRIPDEYMEWIRKTAFDNTGVPFDRWPKEDKAKLYIEVYKRFPELRVG